MATNKQEPKPIYPWAVGMYKPRGRKVYFYPHWPEHIGRGEHAELANNGEAYDLAMALNRKTRDTCREFQENPTVTAEQLRVEFDGMQRQIDAMVAAYTTLALKATDSFLSMIPLLDRMQAMLSQRGKLRGLMDSAKLPTWTAWFEGFTEKLKIKYTLRTIQRKLSEYRGETEKPDPTKRTLHVDRSFLKEARNTAYNAKGLLASMNDWLPYFAPDDTKKKEEWALKTKGWRDFAQKIHDDASALGKEIVRRQDDYGVRIMVGETLIVRKARYRVTENLTADDFHRTKTKGVYRVSLLVREIEAKKADL